MLQGNGLHGPRNQQPGMQKGIDLCQGPRGILYQQGIQGKEWCIGNKGQNAHPLMARMTDGRQGGIALHLPEYGHHVKRGGELGNPGNEDIARGTLITEPSHGTDCRRGDGGGPPEQFGHSGNGRLERVRLQESRQFRGNASHGLRRKGDTADADRPEQSKMPRIAHFLMRVELVREGTGGDTDGISQRQSPNALT